MPAEIAANGGSSTLAADISAVVGVVSIQAGDVGRFPNVPGYQYHIAITDGTNTELCTVTAGFGTANLTVTRASEAYNGVQQGFAFKAGSTIAHVVTIQSLQGLAGDATLSTTLLNWSGLAINTGDVLVVDPTHDAGVVTTAVFDDANGAVVAMGPVQVGAAGYFASIGRVTRVNVLAGVTRGQWLTPSATPRFAAGATQKSTGTFARALSNEGGNGYVDALIIGGGAGSALSNLLVYEAQNVTAATITLPATPAPNGVLDVMVNGQAQMLTRDWTIAGSVITFTSALVADDVHVVYLTAQTFTVSNYFVHYETTLALAASVINLPQTPVGSVLLTRGGIAQYATKGHYTLIGAQITLADAIQPGEDGVISVDYFVAGGGGSDAGSVNGFQAVSAANAAANRLVATDQATGFLPLGIIPQVSVAKLPVGIPNANLATDVARANLLVNGGFEIWQRGSGPFTGVIGPDRWLLYVPVGTLSVSKDTTNMDVASGACAVITSAGGPSSVSPQQLYQYPAHSNDNNAAAQMRGRSLTFSARVKCTVPNGCRLLLQGGVVSPVASSYHSGGGAYETLTATMICPVGMAGVGPSIAFNFEANGTYYVDNAMLVIGSVAVDYQPLTPADDLARCMRYFRTRGGEAGSDPIAIGQASATTQAFGVIPIDVPFAVFASVTFAAPANYSVMSATFVGQACTAVGCDYAARRCVRLVFTTAGGLVAGNAAMLVAANANGIVSMEANP